MINPLYGVKCLKLGFDRYIRYSRIGATMRCSNSSVSFYVDKGDGTKPTNARASNHHPNLQNYPKGGSEPWLSDNTSIEFIVPHSDEDKKKVRQRVYQNASGTIRPFDVTIYQYNSDLIESTDIIEIFKAIVVFLNGGGYTDPFAGTPKKAKIIPRTANIKPRTSTSMTTEGKVHNLSKLSEGKLNVITYLCLGNIITENSKIINKTIMKRNVIHLNEGQLRRVIKESIEKILAENEENESNFYSDDNFENTMAHLAQRGVDKRSRRTRDDTARRATNFFGANKYGGRLPMN